MFLVNSGCRQLISHTLTEVKICVFVLSSLLICCVGIFFVLSVIKFLDFLGLRTLEQIVQTETYDNTYYEQSKLF